MMSKSIIKKLGDKYNLGNCIRMYRAIVGIERSKLASCLGISVEELLQIEMSQVFLSPKRAKEVAEIVKVPVKLFVEVAISDLLKREGIEFEGLNIKFKEKFAGRYKLRHVNESNLWLYLRKFKDFGGMKDEELAELFGITLEKFLLIKCGDILVSTKQLRKIINILNKF